jgi:hypothetical protein
VTTEAKRIALRLDSDPRLASAAGGAVRYLAEAAGMPEEVCREFQQATLQACLKVFAVQAAQSHLVELLVYGDRLEVAIDPASGAAAVKLTRSVVPSH